MLRLEAERRQEAARGLRSALMDVAHHMKDCNEFSLVEELFLQAEERVRAEHVHFGIGNSCSADAWPVVVGAVARAGLDSSLDQEGDRAERSARWAFGAATLAGLPEHVVACTVRKAADSSAGHASCGNHLQNACKGCGMEACMEPYVCCGRLWLRR